MKNFLKGNHFDENRSHDDIQKDIQSSEELVEWVLSFLTSESVTDEEMMYLFNEEVQLLIPKIKEK
ncbi:hypothetical protein [Rossellomorea aquimaris]|uniref:hypothetical protein n=1 Tax=Rossellomorea aquimaris TaxID=189382 RepID=UPI0007D048DD|nr:hypothetical protein [Rossellomorea aquimaris]